mmetsp:Transcript_31365/g.58957  ORF Transcript_31365/g.58957 Transcript_31365/m.58957 type:complete len:409 (-) Transcript_31365:1337-2563(-)
MRDPEAIHVVSKQQWWLATSSFTSIFFPFVEQILASCGYLGITMLAQRLNQLNHLGVNQHFGRDRDSCNGLTRPQHLLLQPFAWVCFQLLCHRVGCLAQSCELRFISLRFLEGLGCGLALSVNALLLQLHFLLLGHVRILFQLIVRRLRLNLCLLVCILLAARSCPARRVLQARLRRLFGRTPRLLPGGFLSSAHHPLVLRSLAVGTRAFGRSVGAALHRGSVATLPGPSLFLPLVPRRPPLCGVVGLVVVRGCRRVHPPSLALAAAQRAIRFVRVRVAPPSRLVRFGHELLPRGAGGGGKFPGPCEASRRCFAIHLAAGVRGGAAVGDGEGGGRGGRVACDAAVALRLHTILRLIQFVDGLPLQRVLECSHKQRERRDGARVGHHHAWGTPLPPSPVQVRGLHHVVQ